ncbi:exopolysaccharide biosynthesis polyprenyl glycosylphosphotransferase [Winogradskyella echinorum]|uniref:Exopolysaccharide biosynthesis polyprenyl glycosylphosphotransferase n=1 Tax=Winogradskyella echinorum TaxID=538189 RepID=A0ABR6Y2M9_9FLAO|nr:exopolysaccharide biosynthesis polyprenyl glycosylphosphotransferase [Winogradskyella echinorum]MBC3846934.1 exopolysaccharide biosynthesis polyprenyl glycosylphosphotransferase [Winogradskyella echinorum]MBC5751282.1 exopolysaccharide biosynthesis polyprenyl glycosylphosphotransferase [Winogradskyella echinorum]
MTKNKGIHFEVSERKILLRIVDLLLVYVGVYCLSLLFNFEYIDVSKDSIIELAVLGIYVTVFGTIFEIYDLQKASKIDTTFRNVVLTASTVVLFYLLTPVLTPYLPLERIQIVYFYIAIIVCILLWRIVYINLIESPRFYKRVLLVGETSNIEGLIKPLINFDSNYKIVGFINSEPTNEESVKFKGLKEFDPKDFLTTIEKEQISEVLVASFNSEAIMVDVYHNLMLLLERGFKIRDYSQVYEELLHKVPIQFVGKDFYKYFPFSRSNENKLYIFFQRTFDVLFATLGLLIGILILPIIVLGNIIGNKGPLFYYQERVGKNSKPFKIVKLRTMIVNAEVDGVKWAKKDDKRITAFGKFLRRSRIDEIPQFYNVLKGDMSIIGPRPERPFFVNELSRIIPFYETRHIIKPGLTGWAQVKTRYGSSIDDSLTKLQYDLFYIKHRSVFLDFNIFIKTMSTILFYRGQ